MYAEWVRQIHLEAVRRWPSLTLDVEAFARYCETLPVTEAEVAPSDGAGLVLCCACLRGDPEALRLFEKESLHVARGAIASVQREREFLEETLQEVWEKLLCPPNAKIAKYTGRGPLQAWVRVTALRVALDRCRRLGLSKTRDSDLCDRLASPQPGIEFVVSRDLYGAAFQAGVHEAVAALPPRDRNALRMHVCGGCNIDEIGRAYGVHRATAARWLDRAKHAIWEGVRGSLLRGGIKLTDSEYSSLARGVASQLDLGLSGSFVQTPERPTTNGS
jgi:RNA polymerase sigma-70 factor (ECF subfamily)